MLWRTERKRPRFRPGISLRQDFRVLVARTSPRKADSGPEAVAGSCWRGITIHYRYPRGEGGPRQEFSAISGLCYAPRTSIREDGGTDFDVLFQVVAVGADNDFMAFLWRRLPGGKVVRD